MCAGVDPDDDLIDARRGQANGLCGARSDHRLAMVTGLHTGDVPLRIEWHMEEPRLDPEWEDVVEASLDVSSPDGIVKESSAIAGYWHRVARGEA